MDDENKIILYTDGAAIGNGTPDSKCGWACILQWRGHEKEKHGSDKGKTNNQMEMLAALYGMQSITDKSIPVEMYCDSKYVVETLNGNYRVGANAELWDELLAEKAKFADIKIVWVKGHAGDPLNERVDMLAYTEAQNAG